RSAARTAPDASAASGSREDGGSRRSTACDDHPPRSPRPRTDGSRRRTADSSRRLAARRLPRLVVLVLVVGGPRRLAADHLDVEVAVVAHQALEAAPLLVQRLAAAVEQRLGRVYLGLAGLDVALLVGELALGGRDDLRVLHLRHLRAGRPAPGRVELSAHMSY